MQFPTPTRSTPRRQALVAEDSLVHQRVAERLLGQRGFQVTVVDNGRAAVVAARGVAFDIILMDVEMPVLDGCDATRQIRHQETQQGLHVPIVAVTSLQDRERVLNAGMDAYIAKPLSPRTLDEILRELPAQTACC